MMLLIGTVPKLYDFGFLLNINNSLVGMWATLKELSKGLWISCRLIQTRVGNLEIFHRAAIPSFPQDREIKGLTKKSDSPILL